MRFAVILWNKNRFFLQDMEKLKKIDTIESVILATLMAVVFFAIAIVAISHNTPAEDIAKAETLGDLETGVTYDIIRPGTRPTLNYTIDNYFDFSSANAYSISCDANAGTINRTGTRIWAYVSSDHKSIYIRFWGKNTANRNFYINIQWSAAVSSENKLSLHIEDYQGRYQETILTESDSCTINFTSFTVQSNQHGFDNGVYPILNYVLQAPIQTVTIPTGVYLLSLPSYNTPAVTLQMNYNVYAIPTSSWTGNPTSGTSTRSGNIITSRITNSLGTMTALSWQPYELQPYDYFGLYTTGTTTLNLASATNDNKVYYNSFYIYELTQQYTGEQNAITNGFYKLADSIQDLQPLLDSNYPIINNGEQWYANRYAQGYDDGISTNIISDSTTGVISAIFSGLFGSIFQVEIFPHFPLYIFLLIPTVFLIFGLVLWLIRGR